MKKPRPPSDLLLHILLQPSNTFTPTYCHALERTTTGTLKHSGTQVASHINWTKQPQIYSKRNNGRTRRHRCRTRKDTKRHPWRRTHDQLGTCQQNINLKRPSIITTRGRFYSKEAKVWSWQDRSFIRLSSPSWTMSAFLFITSSTSFKDGHVSYLAPARFVLSLLLRS